MKDRDKILEEDRNQLFEKLKEVGNLFGIKLKVEEDNCSNNSSAFIGKDKIRLGARINDEVLLIENVMNNIDRYTNIISIEEFIDIPFVIVSFMHELSHLLTMNLNDVMVYRKQYRKVAGFMHSITEVQYRNLPYEKLADNLGYQLLSDNYDQITNILLGNRTIIDKKRVLKNIATAKEFKSIYIK